MRDFGDDMQVILAQETEGMKGAMYARPPFPATWARLHGKGRVVLLANEIPLSVSDAENSVGPLALQPVDSFLLTDRPACESWPQSSPAEQQILLQFQVRLRDLAN